MKHFLNPLFWIINFQNQFIQSEVIAELNMNNINN